MKNKKSLNFETIYFFLKGDFKNRKNLEPSEIDANAILFEMPLHG